MINLVVKLLIVDIFLEFGRVTNLVYGQALKTSGDAIFPVIMGAIFMYLFAVGGTYFLGIHMGLQAVGAYICLLYTSRAQEKTDTIYKIIYTQTDYGTWIFMDIVLGIMFLLSVFFVCYVGEKVIRPFQNMQNLTEELAKGNLSTPIKAEKSRFFGRFLWGMDMLRDTLESNRKKELELQKEKKTLVLSLTHDINTPLSAIRLYTRALAEGLYTEEDKRMEAYRGIEKLSLIHISMRKVNVPVEFHMYPAGGHGLSTCTEQSMNVDGYGVQEQCQSWLPLVRTWLAEKVRCKTDTNVLG